MVVDVNDIVRLLVCWYLVEWNLLYYVDILLLFSLVYKKVFVVLDWLVIGIRCGDDVKNGLVECWGCDDGVV